MTDKNGAPGADRHAEAAYESIRALNHLTRDSQMRPSDVARVLADLADLTAAMPQLFAQLSRALSQAQRDHNLVLDELSDLDDADLAVDVVRLTLENGRQVAVDLYKVLDHAHNTAALLGVEPA